MKRIFPIALLAVCMASCLNVQSDYTPVIYMSHVVDNHGDTLRIKTDTTLHAYKLDSICMGDTIRFGLGFDAKGNNLESTIVSWDTTALQLWATFNKSFTDILIAPSDTSEVQLYYPTGYSYASFPVGFTPKKVGSSTMKLRVTSDSKFSPSEEVFIINVIERKEED